MTASARNSRARLDFRAGQLVNTERRQRTAQTLLSTALVATIFMILALLVVSLATLPGWPYSRTWTLYPSGACGALAMMVVLLVLVGQL